METHAVGCWPVLRMGMFEHGHLIPLGTQKFRCHHPVVADPFMVEERPFDLQLHPPPQLGFAGGLGYKAILPSVLGSKNTIGLSPRRSLCAVHSRARSFMTGSAAMYGKFQPTFFLRLPAQRRFKLGFPRSEPNRPNTDVSSCRNSYFRTHPTLEIR